jgi:hypothetical protein
MVVQEERATFWKVIELMIVREKKVHMNMCLVLNGYRDRAV